MTGCQKSKKKRSSRLAAYNKLRCVHTPSKQHTDTHSNKQWPTCSRAQYL